MVDKVNEVIELSWMYFSILFKKDPNVCVAMAFPSHPGEVSHHGGGGVTTSTKRVVSPLSECRSARERRYGGTPSAPKLTHVELSAPKVNHVTHIDHIAMRGSRRKAEALEQVVAAVRSTIQLSQSSFTRRCSVKASNLVTNSDGHT